MGLGTGLGTGPGPRPASASGAGAGTGGGGTSAAGRTRSPALGQGLLGLGREARSPAGGKGATGGASPPAPASQALAAQVHFLGGFCCRDAGVLATRAVGLTRCASCPLDTHDHKLPCSTR